MKFSILLASCVLALAACGPAPSDQAAPVAAAPAVVEQSVSAASAPATTYLHVVPASLDSCKGQAVAISWDLASDFPGVTGVEIQVGPDGQTKLFSAGGAKGESTTGPWTKPGTIFRLMNKKSGEEIERVVIAGPRC